MNAEQAGRMRNDKGFVAALDQSGGSTPKALKLYGIAEDAYSGDAEMFDLVHEMRSRIITSPSFTGEKVLAAILFEMTMDRQIDGVDTAEYLWTRKRIVPILKVDKGLADEVDGAKLMKPMPDLDALLASRPRQRHLRHQDALVDQLPPIRQASRQWSTSSSRSASTSSTPDSSRSSNQRWTSRPPTRRRSRTNSRPNSWPTSTPLPHSSEVMLKLTIPTVDNLYAELIAHPRVLRVVALSGGYSRAEANALLARNHGLIASFSRALTEGLSVHQSDEEFDAMLATSIDSIYQASIT